MELLYAQALMMDGHGICGDCLEVIIYSINGTENAGDFIINTI